MELVRVGKRRAARARTGRSERSLPRALAITAASIVISEIVATATVRLLRPPFFLAAMVLEALLVVALVFPVLLLGFRPLMRLAKSSSEVQKNLEAANVELEVASRGEREARAAAETIRSAALAMTRSLDLDSVLAALLEHLRRLVPFDRGRVMLLEGESLLRVRAVVRKGHEVEFLRSRPVPFDFSANSVLRELLGEGKGIVITDTHVDKEWGPRMRPDFERSWMGVPLVAGGRPIGLYSLSRAEAGVFLEEHLRLAEALSAPAAIAIQNASLFEELRAGRKHLQTLSRKLVDLQENERRAVARELHDEAGQALTSIKIGLRLLERTSQDAAVAARAAELQRIAEGVQESLHRLAANLRPASLDHLGLVAALGQLVEDLSGSSGTHIGLETTGLGGDRLPAGVETDLYRIAQEALTNALRHARAMEIGVGLERRGGRLRLIIEDDGCGFDPASAERSGRLGLLGMRERAETLGGTLLVESRPGGGTTVVVETVVGETSRER